MPLTPGAILTRPATLDRGNSLIAIQAAAAANPNNSQQFCVGASAAGDEAQQYATYHAQGDDGTVTALSVDVEHSIDNGATWVKQQTIDMNANPVGQFPVTTAGIYRLNPKTVTLGTATKVSVYVNL